MRRNNLLKQACAIFIVSTMLPLMTLGGVGIPATNNAEQLEAARIKKLSSEWFKTFIEHSDQKEITADIIKSSIASLHQSGYIRTSKVLDIAHGEGRLSVALAEAMLETFGYGEFHGIDVDPNFSKETHDKLRKLNVKDINLTVGNCFNGDFNYVTNKVSFILAGNIAYYTEEVSKFVNSVIKKMDYMGAAMFIHESHLSDINILRKKYQSSINTNTADQISESLDALEIAYYSFMMTSYIYFPDNIHLLWEYLEKINYDQYEISKNKDFKEVKYLLEFIAQMPLESLANKNLLRDFIKDVKSKLNSQDNKLIVRSKLHVALNNFSLNKRTIKP